MICGIHNKEMKQNKKGWYCSTPIEKNPDGTVAKWCDFKPTNLAQGITSQSFSESLGQESKKKVDWDAKDRLSAAQTAMKAAAEVYAALAPLSMLEEQTLESMFEDNYKLLMKKMEGK